MTDLPHLAAAIDAESWQWLDDNAPLYATAVQNEINAGKTPQQIRHYVMKQTQRQGIAMRCEQAARHLQRVE